MMKTEITWEQLVDAYAPLYDAGRELELTGLKNSELARRIEHAKDTLYPLIRQIEKENPATFS